MNNIKRETILKLVLIFSIIAILSAYFIQYVLGHQPCNLCLIERIPYISSIIIISAILIFKKIEKILLIVLIIIFMSAFIISLYHFGIEQGFIKESLVCDLSFKISKSLKVKISSVCILTLLKLEFQDLNLQ